MSFAQTWEAAQEKLQEEAETKKVHVKNVTGVTPEQTAAKAPDATTAQNSAASNFDSDVFMKTLGAEKSFLGDYTFKIDRDGDGKTDFISARISAVDDPELRTLIGQNSTENFLTALEKASPDAKGLVNIMRQDPQLAEAFKKAIVEDETMLPELQKLANNNGNDDALNLKKLENLLGTDGATGVLARKKAAEALNKIADSNLTATHLHDVAKQGQGLAALGGFSGLLDKMQNDPGSLIRDMLSGSGLEGTQLGNMLAGLLEGIMPLLKQFIDPNGPILGAYVDLGRKYGPILEENGKEILNDPKTLADEATVSWIHPEDYKTEMAEAVDKISPGSANDESYNVNTLFQANAAIDPRAKQETKLLKDAVNGKGDTPEAMKLKERFKEIAEMPKAEQLKEMQQIQENMNDGQSVTNAVHNATLQV